MTFFSRIYKKACSKVILPVPGFYGWCRALVESDQLWSWSDRRPQTASLLWDRESNNSSISISKFFASLELFKPLSFLLQSSVDVLCRPLHQGVADGGARDRNLFRDGRQRWTQSLSC